jgi:hypothetical protein
MSKAVAKIKQAPPLAPVVITPVELLQIAVEQGADIDKLSKLMDLQERWEATQARKAFVVAKAAFQADAPALTKNKHVGFASSRGGAGTSYDHATLDNITATLAATLSINGLSYSWSTEQDDKGAIKVTCILTHIQGHSERVALQAAADQSGNKNSIQAVGSTVTYLERYTLLAALGLATTDQDQDGVAQDHVAFVTEAQKVELVTLIKSTNTDTRAYLAHFKPPFPSIDEIPSNRFGEAKGALVAKQQQKKAAV